MYGPGRVTWSRSTWLKPVEGYGASVYWINKGSSTGYNIGEGEIACYDYVPILFDNGVTVTGFEIREYDIRDHGNYIKNATVVLPNEIN